MSGLATRRDKNAAADHDLPFSSPHCVKDETFVWGDHIIVVEKKVLGSGGFGNVHRCDSGSARCPSLPSIPDIVVILLKNSHNLKRNVLEDVLVCYG